MRKDNMTIIGICHICKKPCIDGIGITEIEADGVMAHEKCNEMDYKQYLRSIPCADAPHFDNY